MTPDALRDYEEMLEDWARAENSAYALTEAQATINSLRNQISCARLNIAAALTALRGGSIGLVESYLEEAREDLT